MLYLTVTSLRVICAQNVRLNLLYSLEALDTNLCVVELNVTVFCDVQLNKTVLHEVRIKLTPQAENTRYKTY